MGPRPPSAPLDRLLKVFTAIQALGSLAWYLLTFPTLLDSLFKVLTVFLALANLVGFVLIFSRHVHGVHPAGIPDHRVFLIVLFLSLACAVVALRRAAPNGGASPILKRSFLTILGICAVAAVLASSAHGSPAADGARPFPWVTWAIIGLASAGLMIYAFGGTSGRPQPPAA